MTSRLENAALSPSQLLSLPAFDDEQLQRLAHACGRTMTWYKIQHPLQVTTDEGHSVTIPSGLWRVETTPQIVMIGMTNKQTRIEPEQWAAILGGRLAQPLPPWENG